VYFQKNKVAPANDEADETFDPHEVPDDPEEREEGENPLENQFDDGPAQPEPATATPAKRPAPKTSTPTPTTSNTTPDKDAEVMPPPVTPIVLAKRRKTSAEVAAELMRQDPTFQELELDGDDDADKNDDDEDDDGDEFDLENENAAFFPIPPASPISPMLAQAVREDIDKWTALNTEQRRARTPRHQFRDLTGDTDMGVLQLREDTKKEKERKKLEREEKQKQKAMEKALNQSHAATTSKKGGPTKRKR
jgi:hypothetical protein